LRLIYNKVTLRSYSLFLKFSYLNFLRKSFFQLYKKLQSLVKKAQGILGVNHGLMQIWNWTYFVLPKKLVKDVVHLYN
jgi:hypothetical protein